jgi:hypothetical protein
MFILKKLECYFLPKTKDTQTADEWSSYDGYFKE